MQNSKNLTLKDIALRSGFSVKTVSRVINNCRNVNDVTRKKIVDIAKESGYYPNLIARDLKKNRSHVVGYAVPEMRNQFIVGVGLSVESVLKSNGYSVLMSFTGCCSKDEINSLENLISRRVDGIILGTTGENGAFIERISKIYRIPVVLIDNEIEGLKVDVVLQNDVRGAYLLTKHLIEHGHKNVACIAGPLDQTVGKKRLDGYKKALREFRIKVDDDLIKTGDWGFISGFRAANELVGGDVKKITAIFVSNSVMALGVLKALRKRGLKVPEDVAMVSFDNLDVSEFIDPPLTTLGKVEGKIGRIAAKLLLDRMEKDDSVDSRKIYVDAELCIRRSCGCGEV